MIAILRLGIVGLALASAVPATARAQVKEPAADEILRLIPPKAIAVVQVQGIERVQERLGKLLRTAVPDRADAAARSIREAIGDALAGRDLKVLRPDGRLLIAISDLEKLPDAATLTFLFPTTSADEFRKSFLTAEERKSLKQDGKLETVRWEDQPEPFFLVHIAGYTVVTSDRATATGYAKGELAGVAKQLSPESARAFLAADISVFINVREVEARYGEQMKRFRTLIRPFFQADVVQGVNRAQVEQLRNAVEAAFKILEDGTAAVLAVEFRPEGAQITGLAQFRETTATAAALKKYKAGPLSQLGSLPVGQAYYSASMLSLGASFNAGDDDPAAKVAIQKLARDLAAFETGVTMSAGPVLGSNGLEVIESKDADQIVVGRLAVFKALTKSGSFNGIPLMDKPEVVEKAQTVGGVTLYSARLKFDFDRAVADLPDNENGARDNARNALKRSVGGDEITLWLGSDSKRFIQLTAHDWAAAKTLADAYFDPTKSIGKSEGYELVRKQLPSDATMIVVFDATRTAYSLVGLAKGAAAAIPILPSVLPDLTAPIGKPVYVGLTLVLKPEHGRLDAFIPAAAIGQIQKLIQPLLDKQP
jgi:hypothetical protein